MSGYDHAKECRRFAQALRYYDRERLIQTLQYAAEEIEQLKRELAASQRQNSPRKRRLARKRK